MRKFKDLKPESLAALRLYITFWSGKVDLDSSIDAKFDILRTACNTYLAEYPITYAVLLDDKELAKDLCKNGARLDVRDEYNRNKSPLEVAIEYGRAGVANILVKCGAALPRDIKVPSSNPCLNPSGFFWALKERCNNREADYQAVKQVLRTK